MALPILLPVPPATMIAYFFIGFETFGSKVSNWGHTVFFKTLIVQFSLQLEITSKYFRVFYYL